MTAPRGYKKTEVGVIPEDWEVKSLGELGAFLKGSGVRKDESQSGNLPCVRYGEIYTHHHNVIRKFNSHISKDIALTAMRIKKGDILFAGSGETNEEIGKAVAFVDACEAYAGGDIVIFRPFVMNSVFLGYYCNSPVVEREKISLGQGNAVVHISAAALASIKICVPSLVEQTAIAEVLSDTDNLLDSLQHLIDKKQGIKQATMHQLLSGQTRLPGFDGEWQYKTLGDFVDCFAGGGTPSRSNPSYWGDGIYWASVKDTSDFNPFCTQESITELGLQCSASRRIPAGTLILSVRMALGKAVVYKVDIAINQDLKALFLKPNVSVDFLKYWFDLYGGRIESIAGGSTVKGISVSQLKSMELSLPKIEEQTAIAQVLADMDAEITALHKRLDKTRQLKQALMQELLSGRTRLVTPA